MVAREVRWGWLSVVHRESGRAEDRMSQSMSFRRADTSVLSEKPEGERGTEGRGCWVIDSDNEQRL